MAVNVRVIRADYGNAEHGKHILDMMNDYAQDPMGGGQSLTDYAQLHLVKGLADFPGALTCLAYAGERPVGIVNALPGYSSFAAKPLLNIHDLSVVADCRGLGIAQLLLAEIESIARERSCCKVTLEVLEGNLSAQKAYQKFGFSGYELDPKMGRALFWEKKVL